MEILSTAGLLASDAGTELQRKKENKNDGTEEIHIYLPAKGRLLSREREQSTPRRFPGLGKVGGERVALVVERACQPQSVSQTQLSPL